MPSQEKRFKVVWEFVKLGNPAQIDQELQKLSQSAQKAAQQVQQAAGQMQQAGMEMKDLENAVVRINQQGQAVISYNLTRSFEQANQSVQKLRGSFEQAGWAAYHFGMGAMWMNLPMTNFLFTAGNMIQGLDWIRRGFSDIINQMPALAKGLTIGTIALTGIAAAMMSGVKAAEEFIGRIRTLTDVTGHHYSEVSRMVHQFEGMLGPEGTVRAIRGATAAMVNTSMIGMAQQVHANRVAPGPGLGYFPFFQDPFAKFGMRLYENFDPLRRRPRDEDEVLLEAARRTAYTDDRFTRMAGIQNFTQIFGEGFDRLVREFERGREEGESFQETEARIREKGLVGFKPTKEDIENLDAWDDANRELAKTFGEFKAELGRGLIPIFTFFLRGLTTFIRFLNDVGSGLLMILGPFGSFIKLVRDFLGVIGHLRGDEAPKEERRRDDDGGRGPSDPPFRPGRLPGFSETRDAANDAGRVGRLPVSPPTPPKTQVATEGMVAGAQLLDRIGKIALAAGLGPEGSRVARAIATTEGALGGQVGDNGQSFGPFQFHKRGMLPAFAAHVGLPLDQAAQYARQNPEIAAEWALRGYLGNTIRQGMSQGLSGPELATYAQRYGQRSITPEKSGANYARLFGPRGERDDQGSEPPAPPPGGGGSISDSADSTKEAANATWDWAKALRAARGPLDALKAAASQAAGPVKDFSSSADTIPDVWKKIDFPRMGQESKRWGDDVDGSVRRVISVWDILARLTVIRLIILLDVELIVNWINIVLGKWREILNLPPKILEVILRITPNLEGLIRLIDLWNFLVRLVGQKILSVLVPDAAGTYDWLERILGKWNELLNQRPSILDILIPNLRETQDNIVVLQGLWNTLLDLPPKLFMGIFATYEELRGKFNDLKNLWDILLGLPEKVFMALVPNYEDTMLKISNTHQNWDVLFGKPDKVFITQYPAYEDTLSKIINTQQNWDILFGKPGKVFFSDYPMAQIVDGAIATTIGWWNQILALPIKIFQINVNLPDFGAIWNSIPGWVKNGIDVQVRVQSVNVGSNTFGGTSGGSQTTFDSNNYVAPSGTGFITVVGGTTVGTFSSQQEAESSFNDAMWGSGGTTQGHAGLIATKPTWAYVGEGGEPEGVFPLSFLQDFINQPSNIQPSGTGGAPINIYVSVDGADFSDPTTIHRIARDVGDQVARNLRITTGLGRVT